VKESYNVADCRRHGYSASKRILCRRRRAADYAVKDAGGVILGKTNVRSGGDWQSYNDIYGITKPLRPRPARPAALPADRRAGSQPAMTLSLGSDIGGSLRVPAFHCGVYGTSDFALVPSRGHTPRHFRRSRSIATWRDGRWARRGDLSCCSMSWRVRSAGSRQAYRLALPAARHKRPEGFSRIGGRYRSMMPTDAVCAEPSTSSRQSGQGRANVEPAVRYCLTSRTVAALYADADVVPRAFSRPKSMRRTERGGDAAAERPEPRLGAVARPGAQHRAWVLDDGARGAAGAMAQLSKVLTP